MRMKQFGVPPIKPLKSISPMTAALCMRLEARFGRAPLWPPGLSAAARGVGTIRPGDQIDLSCWPAAWSAPDPASGTPQRHQQLIERTADLN
jgi:hypothetical protein